MRSSTAVRVTSTRCIATSPASRISRSQSRALSGLNGDVVLAVAPGAAGAGRPHAVQPVVACATVNDVAARAKIERALEAAELVGASTAEQEIIAAVTVQAVRTGITGDHVGSRASEDILDSAQQVSLAGGGRGDALGEVDPHRSLALGEHHLIRSHHHRGSRCHTAQHVVTVQVIPAVAAHQTVVAGAAAQLVAAGLPISVSFPAPPLSILSKPARAPIALRSTSHRLDLGGHRRRWLRSAAQIPARRRSRPPCPVRGGRTRPAGASRRARTRHHRDGSLGTPIASRQRSAVIGYLNAGIADDDRDIIGLTWSAHKRHEPLRSSRGRRHRRSLAQGGDHQHDDNRDQHRCHSPLRSSRRPASTQPRSIIANATATVNRTDTEQRPEPLGARSRPASPRACARGTRAAAHEHRRDHIPKRRELTASVPETGRDRHAGGSRCRRRGRGHRRAAHVIRRGSVTRDRHDPRVAHLLRATVPHVMAAERGPASVEARRVAAPVVDARA